MLPAAPAIIASLSAAAVTTRIENLHLAVEWDAAAGALTVARTTGEILASVLVGPVGRVVETDLGLDIDGRLTVSLLGNEPFVVLEQVLTNETAAILDVPSVEQPDILLRLGRPASELRRLGTGGLDAPTTETGSYFWLAIADPATRAGVVAGWLNAEKGSGVLFSAPHEGGVALSPRLDYGHLRLQPGASVGMEPLVVGWFDDARLGLEAYAELLATLNSTRLPKQPAGYCTWYAEQHGGASDAAHLLELARFAARELGPFGLNFVQIDDGWQDGLATNGPRKVFERVRPDGPYAGGLEPVAGAVRDLALTPGLWLMPFAGNRDDPYFAPHRDWFARGEDGEPYETDWGGTSLDMSQPGARQYVHDTVERAVRDWGFGYLKLDGLYTGAAARQVYVNAAYRDDALGEATFAEPAASNPGVLRSGLSLVRDAAGRDTFLLGCCAPQNMRSYAAAMGIVDAMRIGPDNGAAWDDLLRGPTFGGRHWFLHGRVWYNDPDPVYVRASMPYEEARLLASWVCLSGQLFASSDWLPALPPERLELLRRTIAPHRKKARPVDAFEHEPARIWVLPQLGKAVVGLFNWTDALLDLDLPMSRLGLRGPRFVAFDYWGDRLLTFGDRLTATVAPHDCLVLALRPAAEQPQVISTSQHLTQGAIELSGETWDGAALRGRSRLIAGDRYELRIALPAGWKATDGGGIVNEPGLARVTLAAEGGGEVDWAVTFARE